ncbi:MAG: caspase family protein [Nannocystaceae bacterium]|nr:caspase family protein [Nannocystaceae bacterium]
MSRSPSIPRARAKTLAAACPTPRRAAWWCALLSLWLVAFAAPRAALADAAEEPETEAAPATEGAVRRFALLVGANDGGNERVRLRYANSDAEAVATVLRQIGGVRDADMIMLRDPNPEELTSAFEDLAQRVRSASRDGKRTQLIFYYSGHSDERGLLLAGERVDYATLRGRVQSMQADVRIAVLDSCASGAFTRSKGGTRRPPFLVGASSSVEGHAFLTSSSADESAQESDRVGGSFFTHFFTTGLRGAADADRDRYVTLTEAYRFAFDETLERTEATRGGPQHAAYDIQLAGSGDLVMTDLHKPSATLVLAKDVVGRVSVRSGSGRLAAELYKTKDAGAMSLAIEPGKYQVMTDDGGARRRADVEIGRGGRVAVEAKDFRVVPTEMVALRGDAYVEVPFDIGLVPPASLNGRAARLRKDPDARIRNRVSASFLWNRAARVDGASISLGVSVIDEELHGIQGGLAASIVRGQATGWQFGMAFNHAYSLVGAQTGFVNSVGTLRRGLQLGLVNTGGRVDGGQLGLVNWAGSADAQVGLMSFTRDGGVHPEVWTSDLASFNFGLRFPARFTYSGFAIGVHPFGRGASWQFGLVFGGHVPIAKGAFVDIDLVSYAILEGMKVTKRPGAVEQIRMLFGWQFKPRLTLYGGPTVSVFVHHVRDGLARPGYGWSVYDRVDGPTAVSLWPGFVAGLRF